MNIRNIRNSACNLIYMGLFYMSTGLFCNVANGQALAELLGLISHDVAQGFVKGSTGYDNITEWLLGDGDNFDGIISESLDQILNKVMGKDYDNLTEWLLGDGLAKDGVIEKSLNVIVKTIIGDKYAGLDEFLLGNASNSGLLKNIEVMLNDLIGNLMDKVNNDLLDSVFQDLPNSVNKIFIETFNSVSVENPTTWSQKFLDMMDRLGNSSFAEIKKSWANNGCGTDPSTCGYYVSLEYGVYSPILVKKATK